MSTVKFGFAAKQMIDEGRVTQEDIHLLKTWLPTQNFPKLTNEQIVLFLLSCQNEQELTKTTIKAYYSIRKSSPNIFDKRRMERKDLRKQMNSIAITVMPERTDDGDVVIFGMLLDTNYTNFNMEIYMMYLFMTLDSVMLDNPPKGLIVLYDLKGMGLMHLTKLKFGLMKTFFQYLQQGLPLRLKRVHIFNTVYFVDKLMSILKPFIKQELIQLAHFHQPNMNMEAFYNHWLPKKCLPEELGGDLPSTRELHARNIKKLTEMQDHFEAEERQRYTLTNYTEMSRVKFGFAAKQMIDEGRVTQEDIRLLKTWLSTQNFPKLTDEQIVLFLLSCQNEQELTKTTIKAYYSIRKRSPNIFDNRRMEREDLRKQMNSIAITVMPERTDDGDVVIFGMLLDTDYTNFNMEIYMMYLFMTLDSVMLDNPPKGLIVLYDMKGMGLMHLTKMKIGLMRTYFQYLQQGLPLRLKRVHIFNTVYFVDKLMTILKPFIKQELIELMHFHQSNMNMESFYNNWLPKKGLPEELGGDLPSISDLHAMNIKKLTEMQDHFEAEERQRHN